MRPPPSNGDPAATTRPRHERDIDDDGNEKLDERFGDTEADCADPRAADLLGWQHVSHGHEEPHQTDEQPSSEDRTLKRIELFHGLIVCVRRHGADREAGWAPGAFSGCAA